MRNPSLLKLSGLMLCFTLALTLCGCATTTPNSVTTLINQTQTATYNHPFYHPSKKTEPQLPSAATVGSELKGRSFEVGHIYFDIVNDDPKQRLDVPDTDIISLFDRPLRQGFAAAKLATGKEPAYTVNVAIVDVRLKQSFTLPCLFQVRMEMVRPDQIKVMSAELRAVYFKFIQIIIPGMVAGLPTCSPLVALSEMLPATAVVITKTVLGLQEGKTLDNIEIYPEEDTLHGVIFPPDLFLKGNPFGIYPLSPAELANVANRLHRQP